MKTVSYKKNLKKLKERVDLYIKNMLWARNPEHYAYMVGIVSAYNVLVEGIDEPINEIPDTPTAWVDNITDQIKRQQDADSQKIIAPEKPKLILP
jgi:hypothetical protein